MSVDKTLNSENQMFIITQCQEMTVKNVVWCKGQPLLRRTLMRRHGIKVYH